MKKFTRKQKEVEEARRVLDKADKSVEDHMKTVASPGSISIIIEEKGHLT